MRARLMRSAMFIRGSNANDKYAPGVATVYRAEIHVSRGKGALDFADEVIAAMYALQREAVDVPPSRTRSTSIKGFL